ncbi:MAG TPA: glycosyltransferase family 39 protein [Aquifex aeolicus]|uniref:Glycosyltransferase family 39 protein n=1 Tax=Aquifex aeolicus TaxID=63363 RepID=A0A7C5QKQ6_AQUAO|nr:glycosyltransferase family 39 protein [Aquifex aeolicus]
MSAYILVPAVLFLYFYNLGLNQVWQPNEAFYAEGAKNMLKTGDFLTPVFNGELRLNKPPMTYWLTALSFYLFGLNEFALRFFQATAGLGTALVTYLFARRLSNGRTAVLSFLVLSLSFQFIANARYTSPEILLCFFTTLSLYLWFLSYQRNSLPLLFLALTSSAFGVLTKGPAGFLLPASIIFIYLLLTDRRELLRLRYYVGTLYVAVTAGWWFLYQLLVNRETFVEIFLKENVKRIYALQEDPFYFYLLDIPVSFLPYSLLFYVALLWVLRNRARRLLFPLLWFAVIFLAFTLVKMKIPVYIMPAFPAMAILTGEFLSSAPQGRVVGGLSLLLSALMILAVLASAVLFSLNLPLLLLSLTVALLPLLRRELRLAPACAGFSLLLYLSGAILPHLEAYRPYREIGERIREVDPRGELRTYEIPAFHYNLPFYADRVVVRGARLEDVKGKALLLIREDLAECRPLGEWELYRGSESRFFKFLMHIRKGENFERFRLCIFNGGI